MRIGFGYDVHALVSGRPLILGGVQIPYPLGLQGHSDADVLIHAICDALLGALADGDIGKHFPDTDPQYKEVRSTLLLKAVSARMAERGYHVLNIDTTVVAERPKIAPFIPGMVKEIADALGIDGRRVSVKATTSEGLGFAGRGEGITAYAVALIQENIAGPEGFKN
jgi:2-C-methyl-D-erythritol 2,4-cyclodiphosphate synthase